MLEAAAVLRPADLRSFDAIHLATAMQLAKELGQLVAYDDRLLRGAEQVGIKAASPQ